MAISQLVKYEGDNTTFIWKFPNEDFNNMTELVVHESQEAIFFANGVAADTFGPGRYKLDAKNIPILTKLLNLVTGVAVFHCEIYFINKTVQMAVKWGTDSKVRFAEPTYGIPVELGACGEMNLAVSDGRKMLINLVGTMKGISWDGEGEGFSKSLSNSFRPLISTAVKANLSAAIKQSNIDIVEVDEHLESLSMMLQAKINPGFEEYGLTIRQFYLTTVMLPETDQNFKRLKELHTIALQKRMAEAEADIRITQARTKASASTVEAEAEAQVTAARRGAILESQTTETEIARREAERQLIRAQAEAQAAQMAGMAEANVMQAKGYNQKDVLQAEVQKAFAEGIGNMGPDTVTGGGSGNMMGDLMGLGVGMAAMNVMVPNMQNMMQGFTSGLGPGNVSTQVEFISCPTCNAQIPARSKFCPECGVPLSRKCAKCGAEIPNGAKFCLECGEKV